MTRQTTIQPAIHAFFDEATFTVSYLVADPVSRMAAVIDPVLDFDPASGEVDTRSADAILTCARDNQYTVIWTLETHAHADHLTASPYVRSRTGAQIGIGSRIGEVQAVFRPIFNMGSDGEGSGGFNHLFDDGETFQIGGLTVTVLHVPGHTPADAAYLVADAAFVGDTLFMPDYGTARTDFPGGDAATLFRSIRRLLDLPAATRLFMCHDYKAPGRAHYAWETSVAAQRAANVHVHDGVTEAEFVAMRTARDATLAAPRLLLPSLQTNIQAGRFPQAAPNGTRYLTIPVRPRTKAAQEAVAA